MAKPRPAFDWAHQISLNALSNGILIINAAAASVDSKIGLIRDVFTYNVMTSEDTGKWMVPFDSACQIGLSTLLNDVLIVVGGASSED